MVGQLLVVNLHLRIEHIAIKEDIEMKKILIMLLLFICSSNAQSTIGVRGEMMMLMNDKIGTHSSLPGGEIKENFVNTAPCFTANLKIPINEIINLYLRPSFILGTYYSGVDGSVLISADVYDRYYLITGMNVHSNIFGKGSGIYEHGFQTSAGFLVVGAGGRFSNKGSVEIQFNFTNPFTYGETYGFVESLGFSIHKKIKLLWYAKLSFGIDWDL